LRDEDDEDDHPKERRPRPTLPAEDRPSGIVTVADLASQLTPERLRWLARRRALGLDFRHLSTITDKWGYIRQGYMEHMPDIMAAARKNRRGWIAPYFYDWATYFSPIEEVAWHAIRGHYGIPLYPQFPLFNFFVDFANPYVCVRLQFDAYERGAIFLSSDLQADSCAVERFDFPTMPHVDTLHGVYKQLT
jgi:hypothetical protein